MATGTSAQTAQCAFDRRVAAGRSLLDATDDLARACHALARRFAAGGTLLAFGNGGPSTDAQHVSVEFVHPVIVGKRALPALSLVTDAATLMGVARRAGLDEVFAHQLQVLGHAEDVALGISSDGHCDNVLRGLEAARDRGMLTVALLGGDGGAIAQAGFVDHVLLAGGDDPHLVKEVHVTAYHLLWELTHVFLEHPDLPDGPAEAPGGVEGLYPFLYGGSTNLDSLLASVAASSTEKAHEIVGLREQFARDHAAAIDACAAAMSDTFAAGAKLLAFGNGGSSSDAQEVVQAFVSPASAGMRPLPALCLTSDVAVVTALSNDVDFDVVFARQIRAFGRPGDIALGLSTSGNSPNLVKAFEAAKQRGMLTVGLAGGGGGRMAESAAIDHLFVVPSSSVHRIQEVQTTLYHVLRELV
jgi:D-sedoheptulose 7-phosphate isomerase